MNVWSIIGRVVLAMLVGVLAAALFQSVASPAAASLIGMAVGAAELIGGLATAQKGAGAGVRAMLKLGAVVLAYPVAGWLLLGAGLADDGARVGLAAAVACAVGMGAARHGHGKESARVLAVLIAVAFPVYAAAAATLSGEVFAMVAACVACAVAPITALVAGVWPDAFPSRFQGAAALAVVGGFGVAMLRWLL